MIYTFLQHQINHGGVQKVPAQVSLCKSHTTEESLRRRRIGRYYHVLSSHSGAAFTTSEGLCHWTPVALSCSLEAGFPLRERTGRNPWMWY